MGVGKGRLRRWLGGLLCSALGVACMAAAAQPAVLQGVVLQDQRAMAVEAMQFKGRPLLLHFVFTGCSATCPTQVRELAQLHRSLPADLRSQLRVLSVSVDPINDTPATLADFARRMGADLPGWHFSTGAPAQVDKLIDRMQAMDTRKPKPAPEDHRTSIYFFAANGALVQRYRGVPVDRVRLAEEMTRAWRAPLVASR